VNWDTALANIEVTFGGPQAPAMALLFDDGISPWKTHRKTMVKSHWESHQITLSHDFSGKLLNEKNAFLCNVK